MKTLLHSTLFLNCFRRIGEMDSLNQADGESFPGSKVTTVSMMVWLAVLMIMAVSTVVNA